MLTRSVASLSIPADPTAKEKHLLRVYIIYRVLTKLGHAEPMVLECLKRMGEKDTWEDGLNWVSPRCVAYSSSAHDCRYLDSCTCANTLLANMIEIMYRWSRI